MNYFLSFSLLIAGVSAASLNDVCSTNNPCTSSNSKCDHFHHSCPNKACGCVANYTYGPTLNICLPGAAFGSPCTTQQQCAGENVACVSGTCQCQQSFKLAGGKCVKNFGTKGFGVVCVDTIQCKGLDSVCVANKCTCYPGHKPVGNDCIPSGLGAICSDNTDCISKSCSGGKCVCGPGKKVTTVGTKSGDTTICLATNMLPVSSGQSCSQVLGSAPCGPGLVCTNCGGGTSICGSLQKFTPAQNSKVDEILKEITATGDIQDNVIAKQDPNTVNTGKSSALLISIYSLFFVKM